MANREVGLDFHAFLTWQQVEMGVLHITTALSRGKNVAYLYRNDSLSVASNRNAIAFVGIGPCYKDPS
jgi:hypothetical protein